MHSSPAPRIIPPSAARRGELEQALRRQLRGGVRFDPASRAMYATDASVYRQLPIGVVEPRDAADIQAAIELCHRFDAAILPRGAGTSLAGQCCNVAVVLDCTRHLNRVLSLDPRSRRARVQPGVVLDDLRAAAEDHGLTFAPDPSTHSRCTIGGMIGNNSCGVHSMMGGKTSENIESLELITGDGLAFSAASIPEDRVADLSARPGREGEIYRGLNALRLEYEALIRQRFVPMPRLVSGYALHQLLPDHGFHVARSLVGTEGTCVTVTEATVRLVPSPPTRALLLLEYDDIALAADAVPALLELQPIGLEGIDERLLEYMRGRPLEPEDRALLPAAGALLMVEFGGADQREAERPARSLIARLPASVRARLLQPGAQARRMWALRESGLGATARTARGARTWPGWEDSAVPPHRLGAYLRQLRLLIDRHGYEGMFYGHFGDGCVHLRLDFDLRSRAGVQKFRAFMEAAADLVVAHGGSLSGEHGDGQARAELLPRMFGPELIHAFRRFKSLWDPAGRMNPGKLVDPFRMDDNLRWGPGWQPARTPTEFRYPDDHGSLVQALTRCVGVGTCRRPSGGLMCPSFMATGEERHSTRGRAHLLLDLLEGAAPGDAVTPADVREALDLCLSCKGCRRDCPTGVDMATYKAEFLAGYYQRHPRPRAAWTMGQIERWCRLAARVPALASFLSASFGHLPALKAVLGVAPERTLPAFAPQTFTQWFSARPRPSGNRPQVLLWPDTFMNYFQPEIGQAAVTVLEHAGFEPLLPPRPLCCGRPLFDHGFLAQARRQLREITTALAPLLRSGIPLVALEPGCLSVFRDELLNLLPGDEDAALLARQARLFSDFLLEAGYHPPRLEADALIHLHCHHRAVLGISAEQQLLAALGLRWQTPEDGCCGMAGAFGFERPHAPLSLRIGERRLLPAVRAAHPDTLVVANGFSCREQIRSAGATPPLHLAEVLEIALRRAAGGIL